MRKNIFTIMMIISVGLSLPGMWKKIMASEKLIYDAENTETMPDKEYLTPNTPTQPDFSVPQPDSDTAQLNPQVPQPDFDTSQPTPQVPQPDSDTAQSEEPDLATEKSFTTIDRTYWSDALFIGDSRTVGLSEYADLGEADVFSYSGMSVYKVFTAELDIDQTGKQTLEELLSAHQYGKIYIMMGINELGYDYDTTVEKYQQMVEKIHQLQPDALLFLEANLHLTKKRSSSDKIYNNASIDRINQALQNMADNKTRFYIDVNEIFDDGQGNLDASYTADDAHVLGKYYTVWADWLLTKGIV